MTSKRTMASKRIEMNGAWYLSAEQVASVLAIGAPGMAERKDFQELGRFIIYDGMRFYSEIYCQQLAAPTAFGLTLYLLGSDGAETRSYQAEATSIATARHRGE